MSDRPRSMPHRPNVAVGRAPDDQTFGEALQVLGLKGTFYCYSEFGAPWGLALPAFEASMMFHVVTEGQCWLHVEGGEPRLLRTGDLAVVPHGEGHRLLSHLGEAATPLFDLPRISVSDHYELLRHGGSGTPTRMLCCLMRLGHPAARQLIRALPHVMHLDAGSALGQTWLQRTLELISLEAPGSRPGSATILTRLADVLVIQAIRAWILRDPMGRTACFGALCDPHIGGALARVHRDPSQTWTVAALAAGSGLSRSAFAARFTELVGEPVMHYVTRWKMHTAATWLKEEDPSLATLASRLGYASEAAFSRAFKRFVGISPGAARLRAS